MNAKEKRIIRDLFIISGGLIVIYFFLGGAPSSLAILGISEETMQMASTITNYIRVGIFFAILLSYISGVYFKRKSQDRKDRESIARTEYRVLFSLLVLFISSFPLYIILALYLPR